MYFQTDCHFVVTHCYLKVLCHPRVGGDPDNAELDSRLRGNDNKEFLSYLEDDLNTPAALHYMHELAKQINKAEDKADLIDQLIACGNLIGLLLVPDWFKSDSSLDVEHIESLIAKRIDAKKSRQFEVADGIRSELIALGVEIEDRPDGTSIWRQKS